MKTVDFRPYLQALSDKAFDPCLSRGRRHPLSRDDDADFAFALNAFALDEDKIIRSKALRRLSDKTQVFVNHFQNHHVRNRQIHTQEVASLAVKIARILGLNIDLCRAIALYHDAGHTPYGHLGEEFIADISGRPFRHEVMSVVLAQKLERAGSGLNLSWEVLEGILHHSIGKNSPQAKRYLPLEYAVVMYSDKIAYTFADLNDALRLGYFTIDNLPAEFKLLGDNQRQQEKSCLYALIKESSEKGYVSFNDSEVANYFEFLRQWSYVNFYEKLNGEGDRVLLREKLKVILDFLHNFLGIFSYDPFLVLALLTDREAHELYKIARGPTKEGLAAINSFSFMEILSRLPEGSKVDIFNPDLKQDDFKFKDLY